jgi:hypothetical protein
MKYLHLLILFLLLSCERGNSQTPEPSLTILKSGSIKLDEFNKIDSIELTTKSLRVNRYTAYFTCGVQNKNPADSTCLSVSGVTIVGNSLKDPGFLKLLRKYTPPFNIIFDDIKVLDLKNQQRTIEAPSIRIL